MTFTNIKQLVFLTITVIIQIAFSSSCYSQTYLEPTLGISYSKNNVFDKNDFPANQLQSDQAFIYSNLIYGLNIWQKIFDRMDLGLILNYQRNYLKYTDWGIVGYTDRRHERFSVSVLTKCKFLNHFELGFGPSIHQLFNANLGQRYSGKWTYPYSDFRQFQLGLKGIVTYQIKSLKLNLSYSHNRSVNHTTDGQIANTQIMTLSLGYLFKISEKSIQID